MIDRRKMLLQSIGVIGMVTLTGPIAFANDAIIVYKSPTCGCCNAWIDHLQAAGFSVRARNVADMTSIKTRHGVPVSMRSCHTAIVGEYVIEGHVPADDIRRLLDEGQQVAGLAVPGMPAGSPGMEMTGHQDQYTVWSFSGDRVEAFAQHN